jgi:hypothetical protein
MGVVGAGFAPEIDFRIALRAARWWRRTVLGHEALLRGPRAHQCSIDREVLRGQQTFGASLPEHLVEQSPAGFMLDQPVTVLRDGRVVPWLVVDRHAHEPPKQQVVSQLLDQHAFAAHRVEHLERQCAQQLLRCNRNASTLGVHRLEHSIHPHTHRVKGLAHRAKGMLLRNEALEASRCKQRILH